MKKFLVTVVLAILACPVPAEPPRAVMDGVVGVTDRGALFSGWVRADSRPLFYCYVVFHGDELVLQTRVRRVDGWGDAKAVEEVTGLEAGSKYDARLVAIAAGEEVLSESMPFATELGGESPVAPASPESAPETGACPASRIALELLGSSPEQVALRARAQVPGNSCLVLRIFDPSGTLAWMTTRYVGGEGMQESVQDFEVLGLRGGVTYRVVVTAGETESEPLTFAVGGASRG